ncbi:hypothetical protein Tco_0168311 [Tanacetum coccineum]
MDDPNITMEEYIRLEEEKARTLEYPAIVFDNISDIAFSREPTVSPLDNNEIDFNISLDKSDDEDYMIVFEKNSFSCKIISVDNLKTDSENENKVNLPSSPSPESTIGYFNDLDFFKDFENEFPAIVYNDLKSKSDPLNVPSTLGDRLSLVYFRDDGEALFTSHAWRRRRMTWRKFILALGLHSKEEMAEPGFRPYWFGSEREIPDKGDLRDYWIEISYDRDFLGPAPSYVHIRNPYLFHHAKGRKSGARLSRGHFIGRLVAHFGLVGDQGLRGLLVVVSKLLQTIAAGAPGAAKGAAVVDEGDQAILAPVQVPQPPPPVLQPQTTSQRIDRLEEEVREMRQSIVGLRGVFESFITEQTRVSTWLISCMTQLMDASGHTYQAFDSTLVSSSRLSYERRVRPMTGDASTFAAPLTDYQPDP